MTLHVQTGLTRRLGAPPPRPMSEGTLVFDPQQSDVGRSGGAALMSPRHVRVCFLLQRAPPDEAGVIENTGTTIFPCTGQGGPPTPARAPAERVRQSLPQPALRDVPLAGHHPSHCRR